ncbi:hypothetical protein HDU67_008782, partial [Dinochytrium kinnereticum]
SLTNFEFIAGISGASLSDPSVRDDECYGYAGNTCLVNTTIRAARVCERYPECAGFILWDPLNGDQSHYIFSDPFQVGGSTKSGIGRIIFISPSINVSTTLPSVGKTYILNGETRTGGVPVPTPDPSTLTVIIPITEPNPTSDPTPTTQPTESSLTIAPETTTTTAPTTATSSESFTTSSSARRVSSQPSLMSGVTVSSLLPGPSESAVAAASGSGGVGAGVTVGVPVAVALGVVGAVVAAVFLRRRRRREKGEVKVVGARGGEIATSPYGGGGAYPSSYGHNVGGGGGGGYGGVRDYHDTPIPLSAVSHSTATTPVGQGITLLSPPPRTASTPMTSHLPSPMEKPRTPETKIVMDNRPTITSTSITMGYEKAGPLVFGGGGRSQYGDEKGGEMSGVTAGIRVVFDWGPEEVVGWMRGWGLNEKIAGRLYDYGLNGTQLLLLTDAGLLNSYGVLDQRVRTDILAHVDQLRQSTASVGSASSNGGGGGVGGGVGAGGGGSGGEMLPPYIG